MPTLVPGFGAKPKHEKAENAIGNPFQITGHHRKMNSATETTVPTNPLQLLRKGLLMSSVASPVTSDIINNSQTDTKFSAYDGSKINKVRTGANAGKSMGLNYQNVDFVRVPETKLNFNSQSKIDTWRHRKMPDYINLGNEWNISEAPIEFNESFKTGTFRSHEKTFLSPIKPVDKIKLSARTSKAHMEAISFVEQHNAKQFEARMLKAVRATEFDLTGNYADTLINDISNEV